MSMTLPEVSELFKEMNLPAFRARQVFDWLHKKLILSYDEMSNLPKGMREELKRVAPLNIPTVENVYRSSLDDTVKFLYAMSDGDYIESVLMKYKYGYTVCVSSQIGCKMGCAFCASTKGGFKRNLTAGEILFQVYNAQKYCGERISHIVMMGMGEPMDNFANVMKFLSLVTSEEGLNISMRNISLSTCGVVPGIERLLSEKLPLTLSVSLHAPTNEIRDKIMPVNKKYPVEELLPLCKKYAIETSRRVSFEYSMMKGFNDTEQCAHRLGSLLKGTLCHVNLIPINIVKESPYLPSDKKAIEEFIKILAKYGVTATVRRRLGSDINASCGQLRRKKNGCD